MTDQIGYDLWKKIKLENDMTKRTNVVYTKKKTELLWPIGPSAVCDES